MEAAPTCTTALNHQDSDSPSSLTAESTMSDSQEQIISNENTETDETAEEDRKIRRVNRRKALAIERSPLPAPKLGRVLTSANNTIDLTNEDDDPSNKWFKKTFANVQRSTETNNPENGKPFAVPHNIPKHAPKSLLVRETLKKKLQASMSVKRRKEQEQRRKMYEEDNEHLKPGSDEEEEEEIIRKKKAKRPKRTTDDDEYNSEDDEDYKEEDSPPENSSDEESDDEMKNKMKENGKADDEMSVNFLDDSFTYDVFNNVKRPGPGSTVSNFDMRSQAGDVEKNGVLQLPTMNGTDDFGDILNLCSGKFRGTQELLNGANEGLPDTLQMLLGEEVPKNNKKCEFVKETSKSLVESENEEEEENVMKKIPKKANRVLDSDEEDEEIVEETPEENAPNQDMFGTETVQETVPLEENVEKHRRIIFNDDDSEEEEEELEEVGGDDKDREELNDEEEEEGEEEVEEQEKEEPEPNFDDEDDELAVIKRIEHQEYKQKLKKKTLFDDEASLSGDDVGSDLEDEEGALNEYEAEEGDADDIPDDDTIRRQNYKLLLKQESDREQRALAKLQDRLLADGDLGGVETNRNFRFKLREETTVQITEEEKNEDDQDDDEQEESEEKKKERAQIIKYKIEHAEELLMLDDPKEDNDLFERAGKLMKTQEKTVVECTEEITMRSRVGKPSLLAKTTLATSFQEVLGGGGGAKQMYVQKYDAPSNLAPSTPSASRSSIGAVKRGRSSPDTPSVKRLRQSKLSALE
ncbi:unnamed protein product [Caenorhabditis sp. 36 PRJEB53466]|nr:unnamed protein product [Caenorhabditis sp. 36 PRJEB53466]